MLVFLALFLLWLLFNGRCTPDVIGFGIVLSMAVSVFAVKICGWSDRKARHFLRIIGQMIVYIFCLFFEIIKANLAVIRVILSPKDGRYAPRIFRFDSCLETKALETILADSITITPGTYTIGVEGRELVVHGLNKEFEDSTPGSGLNHRLIRMQEKLNARRDPGHEGPGSGEGKV
ncbi:MAG: Na+/H+ antiporter subunit E [Eubacterium sp.]|nr:Na+/H+ antiporter subunit E [Eubacterium sp.]